MNCKLFSTIQGELEFTLNGWSHAGQHYFCYKGIVAEAYKSEHASPSPLSSWEIERSCCSVFAGYNSGPDSGFFYLTIVLVATLPSVSQAHPPIPLQLFIDVVKKQTEQVDEFVYIVRVLLNMGETIEHFKDMQMLIES